MLLVHDDCRNHFAAVVEFAINTGCYDKLMQRLDSLATYACHNGESLDITKSKCVLFSDFAPNSFYFRMYKKAGEEYKEWFVGGLIYSGPGQSLDGSGPAFTVSLEATGQEHAWSVHT